MKFIMKSDEILIYCSCLISVERFIPVHGSPKNIWSGRWPQTAYVLREAHRRWSRSRPSRRRMEGIHVPRCRRKRQTRFPNEARRVDQQWVSKSIDNDSGSVHLRETAWIPYQFPDRSRYIKVTLFPVSDAPNKPSKANQSHWIHTWICHESSQENLHLCHFLIIYF